MNDILSSRDCASRLRSTIDAAVQEVRRFGWCILKDIIPAAEADRICMKVGFSIRSQALAPIDGEPFFNGYLVGIRTPVVILSCSPARSRTIQGTSVVGHTVPDEATTYREGNQRSIA